MKESDSFFTTRPTMASYLIEKGFVGKRCVNPYDTKRPAWVFEKTEKLCLAVQNYYNGKEGCNNGKDINK